MTEKNQPRRVRVEIGTGPQGVAALYVDDRRVAGPKDGPVRLLHAFKVDRERLLDTLGAGVEVPVPQPEVPTWLGSVLEGHTQTAQAGRSAYAEREIAEIRGDLPGHATEFVGLHQCARAAPALSAVERSAIALANTAVKNGEPIDMLVTHVLLTVIRRIYGDTEHG